MPSMGTLSLGLAARTEEFERNMERARQSTRRFGAEAKQAGEHGGHSFTLLGEKSVLFSRMGTRGFREVSDAALLFGGTAEGVAGKVSGAFAHMLHGFGHGGAMGLAFVGVTAAIGLIGEAFAKSKEHAEKAEEAKQKALEKTRADAERMATAAETDAERVAQTIERLEEEKFTAAVRNNEKMAQAKGQYYDAVEAKELHANERASASARKQLADEYAAVAELEAKKRGADSETIGVIDKAIAKRRESIGAVREEIAALKERRNEIAQEANERKREKSTAELEAYNRRVEEGHAAEAKAYGDNRVALSGIFAEKQKIAGLTSEEVTALREAETIEKMRAAGLGVMASKYKELVDYEKAMAKYRQNQADTKASNDRIEKENAALARRLETLKASNDLERLQVAHRQEYEKLVRDGANPSRVIAVHAAETANLIKQQTEEKAKYFDGLARQLRMEEAVTDEQKKQVARQQELADAQAKYGNEAADAVRKIQQAQDEADKKRQASADAASKKAGWESGGAGPLATAREAKKNKKRAERFQRHQDNLDAEKREAMGFEGGTFSARENKSSEWGKEFVEDPETGQMVQKWKRRLTPAEAKAQWKKMMARYAKNTPPPPSPAGGQPGIDPDVYGKDGPPPTKPTGLPPVLSEPSKPGEVVDNRGLPDAMFKQGEALKNVQKSVEDASKAATDNVKPIEDTAASADELKTKTEELNTPLTDTATALAATADSMAAAVDVVKGIADEVKRLRDAVDTLLKVGG